MSRVHAARDHAVDLLLGFAAEVGSECRRPCGFRIGAVNAGQGDGAPGARRRLAAADPLSDSVMLDSGWFKDPCIQMAAMPSIVSSEKSDSTS